MKVVTLSVSSVGAEESFLAHWTKAKCTHMAAGAARTDKSWDTVSWRSSDRVCRV